MDPQLPTRAVNRAFRHSWRAEILPGRPPILPVHCYAYPRQAEEMERGALEVMVQPACKARFLATFALGFSDRAAPTGVWSCPNPNELCAVSGGYAYIVNTLEPTTFTHIAFRPVFQPLPLPERNLLVFAGHQALLGWGPSGQAWQTRRLSSEGIRVTDIHGDKLHGFGWDLLRDCEVPFIVNLRTGETFQPVSNSTR